jgi:hypothetical protein
MKDHRFLNDAWESLVNWGMKAIGCVGQWWLVKTWKADDRPTGLRCTIYSLFFYYLYRIIQSLDDIEIRLGLIDVRMRLKVTFLMVGTSFVLRWLSNCVLQVSWK